MTAPLPVSLLAEIIGISADAVICVGSDQRIIFFNEGAGRIFGYAAAEVMGKPLEMLLPDSARGSHRHHVERFIGSSVMARRMGERQRSALRKVCDGALEFLHDEMSRLGAHSGDGAQQRRAPAEKSVVASPSI